MATGLQAFSHLSVLVVDDDPVSAMLVSEYLRTLGFKVEEVGDGKSALARMESALPDLVICDRCMPELSGVEVLEVIRQRGPAWQAVGFVFLTGLTDRRDRYAMMPLHPDGYLTKPIKYAEFDAELTAILNRRQKRIADAAESPQPAASE